MPDISMCQSEECPSRKECYRHEAEPDELTQCYADFESLREGADRCDRFVSIREREVVGKI